MPRRLLPRSTPWRAIWASRRRSSTTPASILTTRCSTCRRPPGTGCSDVNLKGPFLCSQAFGRKRVAAGGGGAIVTLASTAGFSARVGAAHYSASKAGVVMLTKSMAQELGPHGIRVNAVAPGFIEVRDDQVSPDYKQQMIWLIPLGRAGKAPNIANTVAFLVSDAAGFITGECVVVDGGLLTGRPLVRSGSL